MIDKIIIIILKPVSSGGGLLIAAFIVFAGYVQWDRFKSDQATENAISDWKSRIPEIRKSLVPNRSIGGPQRLFVLRQSPIPGKGNEAYPVTVQVTDAGVIGDEPIGTLYYVALNGPDPILMRVLDADRFTSRLPCLTLRFAPLTSELMPGPEQQRQYCFSSPAERLDFWRSFIAGYGAWQTSHAYLSRLRQQNSAQTQAASGLYAHQFAPRHR